MKNYQKEFEEFKKEKQKIKEKEDVFKKELIEELKKVIQKSSVTINDSNIIVVNGYFEENDGLFVHFSIFDNINTWLCNIKVNIKNNKFYIERG